MHLRQVESYMHLFIIPEAGKPRLDFFIIKKSKFIFSYFYLPLPGSKYIIYN